MNGAATSMTGTARAWALCCLTLALLVRLAMPAGWMPSPAGGFAITLCTGSGPVAARMDADGKFHKQPADQAPAADHPCTFAALGGPLLPAATAMLAAPTAVALAVLPLGLGEIAVGRGLSAPPPPATGPPAAR
jgi:hypothetical protein